MLKNKKLKIYLKLLQKQHRLFQSLIQHLFNDFFCYSKLLLFFVLDSFTGYYHDYKIIQNMFFEIKATQFS